MSGFQFSRFSVSRPGWRRENLARQAADVVTGAVPEWLGPRPGDREQGRRSPARTAPLPGFPTCTMTSPPGATRGAQAGTGKCDGIGPSRFLLEVLYKEGPSLNGKAIFPRFSLKSRMQQHLSFHTGGRYFREQSELALSRSSQIANGTWKVSA